MDMSLVEQPDHSGVVPVLKPASAALQAAVRAGNINIADGGKMEILDLSSTSIAEQDRHAALLKRVEAERRARQIVVPTNPDEVRERLRAMGQPVRLFGEDLADIRERLKELLAKIEIEGIEKVAGGMLPPGLMPLMPGTAPPLAPGGGAASGADKPAQKQSDVYSEASAQLLQERSAIAAFSFEKARERIRGVKRRRENDSEIERDGKAAEELYESMKNLRIVASQLGDDRPLTTVRCAPNGGNMVATGSFANVVKLWDGSSLERLSTLGITKGQLERTTGLAWSPTAFTQAESPSVLLTGSADGTAGIWDCRRGLDEEARHLGTLRGHQNRLTMVDMHPTGRYAATASFDLTWRLWDIETSKELLLQDGHLKEVYFIACQPDGALVATGDLCGIGQVWDLRAGKLVYTMQGHVKRITCGHFAPNSFQVATGGDDHTVRIFDLRHKKCSYVIPAHSHMISDVRFQSAPGEVMLTTSFDGHVRAWSTRDWRLVMDLTGHDGKIMGGDIMEGALDASGSSSSSKSISGLFTVGYDRTLKQWSREEDSHLAGYL